MLKTALLVVDPQVDFCPDGALPVTSGDDIIEPLLNILQLADTLGWTILVSRDWHPRETSHFAEFGGQWPVHCVQDTPGAEFNADLEINRDADTIVSKGMKPNEDGYSPLCENAFVPDGRTAVQYLQDEGVSTLYIGGFCVKAGVLDALKLPFIEKVYLLTDAIGTMNIKPGDSYRAIADMLDEGVILTTTTGVVDEKQPVTEVINSRKPAADFEDDDFDDYSDDFIEEDSGEDTFEDDWAEEDEFDEEE